MIFQWEDFPALSVYIVHLQKNKDSLWASVSCVWVLRHRHTGTHTSIQVQDMPHQLVFFYTYFSIYSVV